MLRKLDLAVTTKSGEFVFSDIKLKQYSYRHDAYELQVDFCDGVLDLTMKRDDGEIMEIEEICYTVEASLPNFSKVIVPDSGREYNKNIYPLNCWFDGGRSYAVGGESNGYPFICFIDQEEHASFAFGSLEENIKSEFFIDEPGFSKKVQCLVVYNHRLLLRMKRPGSDYRYGNTSVMREKLYIKCDQPNWYLAMRDYGTTFKQLNNIKPVEQSDALEPTWCTWTAWNSDDMCDELIYSNAKAAAEAGIKTIIIDDGWFGPGQDTDYDERKTGDYFPDERKLPDFKATIERIQKLGLKVLLWIGGTSLAPLSESISKLKPLTIVTGDGEYLARGKLYQICPACAAGRKHIVDTVVRLMRDYGLDGLKTDMYNLLPDRCVASEHEHDQTTITQGLATLMREIWEAVIRVNPDAMLELKQDYGNALLAQFGSMIRVSDSPYDPDMNLFRGLYINATIRPVHNDYLVWNDFEKINQLGIIFIKQLIVGVPTFSLDFANMSNEHKQILIGWLRVYDEIKSLQLTAWLQPMTNTLDSWSRCSGEIGFAAAVYGARELFLQECSKQYLFNGTCRDNIICCSNKDVFGNMTIFSPSHIILKKYETNITDSTRTPIPAGGYAIFTRKV